MFKKVLALLVAAVLSGVTGYAQQYEEVPFIPGQPPPEARPGEAWCIYVYPAEYEIVEEEVKVRDELMNMRPIRAEYGQETEDFICAPAYSVGTVRPVQFAPRDLAIPEPVVPAHKVLRVIPAQFRDVQRVVEVFPAYMEKYWVPAQFGSEMRAFVIAPERKELRKVQCVDGTNIDCFTVVGQPEQTQTVEIKTLISDGYVAERPIAARTETIAIKELVRDAYVEEQLVPAQTGTYRGNIIAVESSVDIGQVPPQMGKVTRMTIIREASIVPERVPAVFQTQQRKVLKTPERPVWRKQLLNQMTYVAPPAPMPISDVAGDAIVQHFGSIPGTAAFRTPRVLYQ